MRRIVCILLCLTVLIPPVQAAEPEKLVALTFDDGPWGRCTGKLLEGLEKRGAKATFFLTGCCMAENPEQTQQIRAQGHEIGIRSFDELHLTRLSRRKIAAQIVNTRALLPQGYKVRWMRPPGGLVSDGMEQVAKAKNLALLDWSVEGSFPETVPDGAVVRLRHDSDWEVLTALALVDRLQKQGFRCVTVTELARLRAVSPKPGGIYREFPRKTVIRRG